MKNLIIQDYDIKENNKKEILISFPEVTKKINDVASVKHRYDKEIKLIVLDYKMKNGDEFNYILKSIPVEFINKINKQKVILIKEVTLVPDNSFYYDSINSRLEM